MATPAENIQHDPLPVPTKKRLTTDDVVSLELGPTQSVMAIINEEGDKKTVWDRNNPVEVEAARREFDFLKGEKKYMAYRVEGKDGTKGEVLERFDPNAERIIFSPPIRGGR